MSHDSPAASGSTATGISCADGLGFLRRRGIGFNLAKAMIQLRRFLVHPLTIARTCVVLRIRLLMKDLLFTFQRSDPLLNAAQLLGQYTEMALIASLLRGYKPRFRQCGPKAISECR